MNTRSPKRQKIEKAIVASGVKVNIDSGAVFTDKSKSGWRIKYGFKNLSEKKLKRVRKALREEFPKQDFRVWNVKPAHSYAIGGLAIKIFN